MSAVHNVDNRDDNTRGEDEQRLAMHRGSRPLRMSYPMSTTATHNLRYFRGLPQDARRNGDLGATVPTAPADLLQSIRHGDGCVGCMQNWDESSLLKTHGRHFRTGRTGVDKGEIVSADDDATPPQRAEAMLIGVMWPEVGSMLDRIDRSILESRTRTEDLDLSHRVRGPRRASSTSDTSHQEDK